MDQPLVVLFDQEHAGEADQRAVVGVDPTTSERRPISLLTRSSGLVDLQLGPVLPRKHRTRAAVLGLFEQRGDLRRRRLESVDDLGEPFAGSPPVSALKIWRIAVAIIGCWERPQWPSMSRRK